MGRGKRVGLLGDKCEPWSLWPPHVDRQHRALEGGLLGSDVG